MEKMAHLIALARRFVSLSKPAHLNIMLYKAVLMNPTKRSSQKFRRCGAITKLQIVEQPL